MVNRGASRGCMTCRQRRVKCDERKPWCRQCLLLGRECAGYGRKRPRLRFKDETARYSGIQPDQGAHIRHSNREVAKTPKHKPTTISRNDCSILPSLQPHQQDLAVSFFLNYVTNIGRSLESTRGFLEFVRPALATQRHDSALFAAVNAAASKLWMILGYYGSSASQPIKLHSKALVRLQKAVQDPEERRHDATVLAALMLQVYDTLSAISGQHRAHGTHRDGALALLLQRGDDGSDSKYHANLVGNLLHSKVSLCVRERRPLPSSDRGWLKSQALAIEPVNPSCLLDHIGIAVADLQHTFHESWATKKDVDSSGLSDLLDQIRTVDGQLRMWLEVVPQHWYPKRMQSGRDIDLSIETYKGSCDVYPSIQIANIWNGWRIYCLILQQIKLRLASDVPSPSPKQTSNLHHISQSVRITHEVQELVDSICHSIAFYLGNCTSPPTLSDMENPKFIFPSYHDLDPTDEDFLRYRVGDHYVSRVDHSRHVLLQGHLHCMSLLSQFLGLFPEQDTLVAAQTLRQGQMQWIADQFMRSLYLLRQIPHRSLNDIGHHHKESQSQKLATKVSQAEAMASTMREGLWTVNIL
ncbi:hypothetical protein NM208_g1309 [Fusarium decemcellulare]|uniref:Uncharacterized protein n=1 Tax=Fusarium decemcellulare TaxID=57161 RepID=A0ACC1SWD9_9HYPO|nr:hypothetical protein NM208_g1309 [Fusarium decemcellulare]